MPLPENKSSADPSVRWPLVVILGPTAVGKTELSLQLAERLGGEIVSADSRLFYRGMDIGTAKPTLAERRGIPHHLIDVVDPDETFSLAVFQQEVNRLCREIHTRGRQPFLVGGTGQYVTAVVEGWQSPEVKPAPELRAALQAWTDEIGGDGLYARLYRMQFKLEEKPPATIEITKDETQPKRRSLDFFSRLSSD